MFVTVRLETRDGLFVAMTEVPAYVIPPDVVVWGERFFKFHQNEPQAMYRECFVAISFTTPERAKELSKEILF